MICGGCKRPFSLTAFILIHWLQTGCSWTRSVWARVLQARRRGTSGRRILTKAFPEVYKTKPMPPEAIAARRAGAAVKE